MGGRTTETCGTKWSPYAPSANPRPEVDLARHEDTLNIQRPGIDPLAVGRIHQLLEERGE